MATTTRLRDADAGSQCKRKASSPAPSDASERRVRDEHLRNIKREPSPSPEEEPVRRHRDGDASPPQEDNADAPANMTDGSPTDRGRATSAGYPERLPSFHDHVDFGHQAPANISAQFSPGNNGQPTHLAMGDVLADGAVGTCLDAIENFPLHDEMYTTAMRRLIRHACASASVSQSGGSGRDIIDGIIRRLSTRDLDGEKQDQIAEALIAAWAGQQGADLAKTMPNFAAVGSFLEAFVSAVPATVRCSLPASLAEAVANLAYLNKQNGSLSAEGSVIRFARTEGQAGQAPTALRKTHGESTIVGEESYWKSHGVDPTLSGKVTGSPNVPLARRREKEPNPVLKEDPSQRAPRIDTARLKAEGLRERKHRFAQRFPRSCDIFHFHIHELCRRGFPRSWPQALRNHDRLRTVSEIVWDALDADVRHVWDSLHAQLLEGNSEPLDAGVGDTLIQQQDILNRTVTAHGGSRHLQTNGYLHLAQPLCTTEPAPAVLEAGQYIHRNQPDSFEPTFVDFVACARDSARVLYTVNAPNAPFSDISAAELQSACAARFTCEANGLPVAQLNQKAWAVTFASQSIARTAMDREIVLRGRPVTADHLRLKAPGVFFWDASEVEVSASEVLERITEAFADRDCRPEVLQQDTRERNGFSKLYAGQQFIVRFDRKPGLFSFFVPLKTSCSSSPRTAWFKPMDYAVPCLLCKEKHRKGTVCEHAKLINQSTTD